MIRCAYLFPLIGVFAFVLTGPFPSDMHGQAAKTDWLQFAFSPDKTANNTSESTISLSNVSGLKLLYDVALPGADNPDGAPVLLSDVSTPVGIRDLVFVQGEHGHITAFDGNNGATIWSKDFSGGSGINDSAPAIDPNRKFIYLDTNDGFVHKLNVGDGSEVTGGGWPENHGGGKGGSQLTIATARDGHTYLYASNHGDGHITTIDVTTGAQHVFNASCSQFPNVQNPSGCTSTGARPWARGNPYIPALDKFFFMTGTNNGNPWNGCTMWKDSWLALPADGSTNLVGGCGMPADSWTGTDVVTTVAHDQDIGAGGLTPLPDGFSSKFPHLGVNPGKDARIRILDLDNLSGQGGPGHQGGAVVQMSYSMGSEMRAQSAVWTNPANGEVWVFVVGNSGTHGFTVDVDSAGNPTLTNHWNIQNGWTTSAVVANGVLFTAADGGEHTGSGTVHQVQAINPTTGAMLWTGKIDLFHWESPIVVNGTVYMADGNAGGGFTGPGGHLRAWRIPGGTTNPDFSVAVSPVSQTVTVSQSTSYTVDVSAINGFSGGVALSTGSLPAGVTASFNPASVTGSGTSTLTLSTSASTPVGSFSISISGTSGATTHSTTASLTTVHVSPVCVTASGNNTFNNSSFPSQSGTFTTTFDMTPSSGAISAVIGISHGVQTNNTGFANIVALSTTGFFQVRDGGTYFTSTIHYAAGITYHIRLAIDVTTHTYSAFVTPPGGTEQTIRAGAAFRTEQDTVTSLDHWGVKDSTAGSTLEVCNFSVQ
jgi:hypothetical protein